MARALPERKEPQETPGVAELSFGPDDDWTLPAAPYGDAVEFLLAAERARIRSSAAEDGRERSEALQVEERFSTAATVAAFAALEAQVNQAAFAHARAHQADLEAFTVDVLTKTETSVDSNGRIERRARYRPMAVRLQFLCVPRGRTVREVRPEGTGLIQARDLRDACAHPKPPFRRPAAEDARHAIGAVYEFLAALSETMSAEPPLRLAPLPELAGHRSRRLRGD